MDLSWLQSITYGFLSGLLDILPVSAKAHKILMLKFVGVKESTDFFELLIHIGIFAALYYSSQSHMLRMNRARALARIPKKKRKRPLDTRSLMDWSLLKTICIPAILVMYLYQYTKQWEENLLLVALFLFINGIVLYIPQFFPTGNRDSRTLSRIEGVLMGLGGAASVLPGVSAVGTATSVASVCGVERSYSLNMVIMMNMIFTVGFAVYDIIGIANNGLELFSFMMVLRYLVTMAAAFCGTLLGIRVLRNLASKMDYHFFGVYCWGVALFVFILNLIA